MISPAGCKTPGAPQCQAGNRDFLAMFVHLYGENMPMVLDVISASMHERALAETDQSSQAYKGMGALAGIV